MKRCKYYTEPCTCFPSPSFVHILYRCIYITHPFYIALNVSYYTMLVGWYTYMYIFITYVHIVHGYFLFSCTHCIYVLVVIIFWCPTYSSIHAIFAFDAMCVLHYVFIWLIWASLRRVYVMDVLSLVYCGLSSSRWLIKKWLKKICDRKI